MQNYKFYAHALNNGCQLVVIVTGVRALAWAMELTVNNYTQEHSLNANRYVTDYIYYQTKYTAFRSPTILC